ncbi:adenylylsulfate reductase, thioredoxin dependent [Leptospira ryugenii]|uniref:Adenosine 5'-phosphosulfate reductase n=1 Tax=Leptospira ryugenii TaxID=1917863 RepID=A0A2P2DVG0_9LEPT|nr:phosphoadenylyl-sulfate reductase [Leptospira ryugenii]GBF48622.1 adenylylsulfate reductase, thioredoxin dependent [Leptospira ryugenii]
MNVQELTETLIGKDSLGILKTIDSKYGSEAVFTSSFGLEDQIITHLIFSQGLNIRVVTLDTGRLFKETYEVQQRTLDQYGKKIEVFFPDPKDLERYLTEKGPNAFYQSIELRKECCHIRKVLPLNRALVGAKLWITGIRKEQSGNRNDMPLVEIDSAKEILKVHPILQWSWEDCLSFAKENKIPYNPLHEEGYPSIGCAPCTRAIEPGEDFRAGRWWWENEDTKECGLHWVDGKLTRKKGN